MKNKKIHKYLGHSSVYYRGSNPYSLYWCDYGSFYSIYFTGLPTIHIYKGYTGNYISGGEVEKRMPEAYRRHFIEWLKDDLKDKFDLEVDDII